VFDAGEGPFVAINPKMEKKEGEIIFMEGCLSLPGYYWDIERAEYARISCLNEKGEKVVYEGEDLLGRVLQHEYDHLKGRLLIKSLKRKDRKEALREMSIKGFPGDKI
jgi:peptide deformylase